MENILTLDAAREKFANLGTQEREVRMHSLKPTFDGKKILVEVGDRQVDVTPHAARNLKFYTGIDGRVLPEYADDPDLVTAMIRHSLEKRPDATMRVVTQGGNDFDAVAEVLDKDYPFMTMEAKFEALVAALGPDTIEGVADIYGHRDSSRVKVITHMNSAPPKKNDDISHAGVWMSSNGQLEVASFVHRMVCSNGMMADWQVSKVGKTRKDMRENFQDAVRGSIVMAAQRLEQFIALDDHVETNAPAFLTAMNRESQMTDSQFATAMGDLPALGEAPSRYDIVNMLTFLAHDDDRNPDNWGWIGGRATERFQSHDCTHCHQPL